MSDTLLHNPYAVPASNLQQDLVSTPVSIDTALARGYDFSTSEVIGEAWRGVKGTKGIILAGLVVFYVAMLLLSAVVGGVFGVGGALLGGGLAAIVVTQLLVALAVSVLSYPFLAGLMMIGVRRAAGQPVSFNTLFGYFNKTLPLLGTGLLMTVVIYAGLLLFVIPGIYLAVAYMLAMHLVVERGLSPWQAMEASRKAITQHWFKTFGLFFALWLLLLVSALPFGIGLIWTMPLLIIATGVLYRTIFGVLPAPN